MVHVLLMVGIVSIFTASGIGMLLGLTAGYYSKNYGAVVMRFIDALMAFPMILMALVIAALLGGGITNVIIAIGISLTAVYARYSSSESSMLKQENTLGRKY